MFAIYTPVGRSFYGPLEQLRRVSRTHSTKLKDAPFPVAGTPNPEDETIENYGVTSNSVQQYREVLLEQGQNREQVFHCYQLMNSNVEFISEDMTLEQTYEKFIEKDFAMFPVISAQQQLIGTIERSDIMKSMLSASSPIEYKKKLVRDWLRRL